MFSLRWCFSSFLTGRSLDRRMPNADCLVSGATRQVPYGHELIGNDLARGSSILSIRRVTLYVPSFFSSDSMLSKADAKCTAEKLALIAGFTAGCEPECTGGGAQVAEQLAANRWQAQRAAQLTAQPARTSREVWRDPIPTPWCSINSMCVCVCVCVCACVRFCVGGFFAVCIAGRAAS